MRLRSATNFLANLSHGRRTIRALTTREIMSRYSGTFLGSMWELVHPVVTILVYWFVFSIAFKAKGPQGIPFIVYFVTGILPWMFFTDAINNGTRGVVAHGFLVKKMAFQSELIPFVYLTAAAVNHGLLMILALLVLLANGIFFTWHWFQLIYYFFTLCALMTGLLWLLSAVNVFHRDLAQGVGIFLNLWFWATPIVWVADGIVPKEYLWLVSINPLYYVIEGYRGSLLYHEPIWRHWQQGIYVWALALALLAMGAMVFRRLKPHFGDVL